MRSPIQTFLEEGGFLVMENPVMGHTDAGAVLGDLPRLDGHCLFRTSGTEGESKFVALSREAVIRSAKSVIARFSISKNDRWLRVLPEFHVGGFGIHARAQIAGCGIDVIDRRWDPSSFVAEGIRAGSTLTSLVPTQVFDLVSGRFKAPPSLRVAIVGGGALDGEMRARATELGWPLVGTYGMTETGSQMAVERDREEGFIDGSVPFVPLEGWEMRTAENGALELRGKALFSGYVREKDGRFEFEDAKDADGWFTSSDRVELTERGLVFKGRLSSEVKVLGELANLERIQSEVAKTATALKTDPRNFAVVAVDDPRRENLLVLADASGTGKGEELRKAANRNLAGFERIVQSIAVDEIPRSTLGKILSAPLKGIVAGRMSDYQV